MEYWTT